MELEGKAAGDPGSGGGTCQTDRCCPNLLKGEPAVFDRGGEKRGFEQHGELLLLRMVLNLFEIILCVWQAGRTKHVKGFWGASNNGSKLRFVMQ